MSTSKKQNVVKGKAIARRPEIRDDMDSREHKEEGYKSNNNSRGVKPNTKSKNKAGN